jgi:hypothetical protein
VENKQPSEWAMKKADELFWQEVRPVEAIAKELDSLKAQSSDSLLKQLGHKSQQFIEAMQTIQKLQSQADGLARALSGMLVFYGMDKKKGEVSGVVHDKAEKALEAYRKGK